VQSDVESWLERGQVVKPVASNSLREVTVDIEPVDRDALLTPAQVAAMLYVDPKTVTRWAMAGKIGSVSPTVVASLLARLVALSTRVSSGQTDSAAGGRQQSSQQDCGPRCREPAEDG
jgi:hypothetical protein